MSEYMIEINDLTRYYGPTLALDGISLKVKRGEVMGFLGPNGAGKTTAMRILAGLLSPSSGSVRIADMDVIDNPIQTRARIGFLPETPPIYTEMTVREYLAYLATLRGVPNSRLADALERTMTRCGLTQVADRLLRNLSKGYRQRAGIAQAIVHSPDVVILDEPTVGLDPIQIREIRNLIKELGGEHSVLLSTHILPEVQMTCNRVAVINKGRIVAEDTLEELNRRSQSQGALSLRWNAPPEAAVLRAIPGVDRADADGAVWNILPAPGADPLPEILRRSVEHNWDLREIAPSSRTLEEIFLHLTTREGADSAQEAA